MGFAERSPRGRRRHANGIVTRENPPDQFAFFRIPRNDDTCLGKCTFFGVEAEVGHADFFVGTMAHEAVLGEDRPNLPVEVYVRLF